MKKYVGVSPAVYAFASGWNKTYTNVKSVKLDKRCISLTNGSSHTIDARIIKRKKDRELVPETCVANLRYKSSNEAVATVDKSGKVTACGTGQCTINVFASNGVRRKLYVTVK